MLIAAAMPPYVLEFPIADEITLDDPTLPPLAPYRTLRYYQLDLRTRGGGRRYAYREPT
jgi:hypothetical protein